MGHHQAVELIAEDDGRAVGGIGILYAPHVWNPLLLSAEQIFWLVAEDAPFKTAWLLINDALRRMDEKKAIPTFRIPEKNSRSVGRILKRFGLVPIETVFTRTC